MITAMGLRLSCLTPKIAPASSSIVTDYWLNTNLSVPQDLTQALTPPRFKIHVELLLKKNNPTIQTCSRLPLNQSHLSKHRLATVGKREGILTRKNILLQSVGR